MEALHLSILFILFLLITISKSLFTSYQKTTKKHYNNKNYVDEEGTDSSSSSSSSSSSLSLFSLPPSPSSLPLLGHLHLVKKPLHRSLEAISRQYGPLVFLRFGSRPVILVSGPSAVNECFTKNDVVLANRPQMLAAKHLNYNFTTIVSASYGSMWRNLRRFTILEIFSMARLQISAIIRREEVDAFVRNLAKDYSGKDGSKRFDEWKKLEMKSRFNELVFNSITKMIGLKRYFGEDVREEDLEEAKMFKEIMRESVELIGSPYIGDYLPFMRWLDLKGLEKRMIRLKRRRDEFLRRAVGERRKLRANSNSNSNSFSSTSNATAAATTIDVLLTLQEREPDFYTDEIIHGIVMTLLTTGTHTSAITMEWAMALMLNHPRTLAKARAEIDSQIGTDRLLQESDLPDLTYLNSIINETLRLFPPTAIIVPHEASSDCTVGGFKVPHGTMLLVNAWAVHRNPNNWLDPEEFKPERFDTEDNHGNDFKFIPFGLGRRGCPGTRMAMRMIGLTLGRLVQCLEWERVGEEKVEMSEGPGVTIPKVRPLEALYRPRQELANVLEKY